MKQTKKKIEALEKELRHVGEPDGLIIYKPGPGEPEASIKRFEEQYPDYPWSIIALPELERD